MKTTGQKVLLLLFAGFSLGFTYSPTRARKVLHELAREWRAIDRDKLYRSVSTLYKSRLVTYIEKQDGSIEIVLNQKGKKVALCYKLDLMRISRPKEWDTRWRIIIFDIPEVKKNLRDTIRQKLRQLGLLELQKSVFVHPFECRNEIDFLIELYHARKFVRFIEAYHIDNELHLKKKFKLL